MRTLLLLAAAAAFSASGCKKAKVASAVASAEPAPSGGAADTNYMPSGGAVQNSRRAAERIKVDAELQQLGQLMEVQFNELGRMPTVAEVKGYLTQSQNILGHITEGNIVLTGTKNHAGLWAYQKNADTLGGLVLVAGTANRCAKDDFAALPR